MRESELNAQWASLKKAFREAPVGSNAEELNAALALEESVTSRHRQLIRCESRFRVFLVICALLGLLIPGTLGVVLLAFAFFGVHAVVSMKEDLLRTEGLLREIKQLSQPLSEDPVLCKEALSLVDSHRGAAALRDLVVNAGEALRGHHLLSMQGIAMKETEAQSMSYCRKLHLIPEATA